VFNGDITKGRYMLTVIVIEKGRYMLN